MNKEFYTIEELAQMIESKEVKPSEVNAFYAKRVEQYNKPLNAILQVNAEWEQKARELDDKEITNPLFGLPIGLKDNMAKTGMQMTCASKMLENFVSPYDATVTEKLESNGVIISSKLNMDEFAMGSSNEHSYFGVVSNPWDYDRVPGGSSGGSAAAVAAGLMPGSLGSDTGGSVRQPAAFTGLVGLKPTYGTVSRYGVVAFASSLDQIGPFTRTVVDNALLYNGISGRDLKDSTTVSVPAMDIQKIKQQKDFTGLKFALPTEFMGAGLDEETKAKVLEVCQYIESLGGKVEEVSIPELPYVMQAYYIIAPSEASSNLARFDGIRYGHRSNDAVNLEEIYTKSRREGFGEEVRRRIMIGTYTLSASQFDAYYMKASRLRRVLFEKFDAILGEYAAIIGPTASTTAYKIGELIDDPVQMYYNDLYTIPANLTGLPNISIPVGFDNKGLPIGFQLLGARMSEQQLYQYSYVIEQRYNCLDRQPNLKKGGE
ncbi:MAG: Asp-tRNA(Asn)/Glu-tRNA(Gln) amidotransferase subunit GatA [Culicoidibacterales bacterium]